MCPRSPRLLRLSIFLSVDNFKQFGKATYKLGLLLYFKAHYIFQVTHLQQCVQKNSNPMVSPNSLGRQVFVAQDTFHAASPHYYKSQNVILNSYVEQIVHSHHHKFSRSSGVMLTCQHLLQTTKAHFLSKFSEFVFREYILLTRGGEDY